MFNDACYDVTPSVLDSDDGGDDDDNDERQPEPRQVSLLDGTMDPRRDEVVGGSGPHASVEVTDVDATSSANNNNSSSSVEVTDVDATSLAAVSGAESMTHPDHSLTR